MFDINWIDMDFGTAEGINEDDELAATIRKGNYLALETTQVAAYNLDFTTFDIFACERYRTV